MTDPAFTLPEDVQARRAAAGEAARRKSARLARDFAETFTAAAGARVLDDLIGRFAGRTYTRGDHHHTAFREGQRAVIEYIAQAIGRAAQQQKDSDHDR